MNNAYFLIYNLYNYVIILTYFFLSCPFFSIERRSLSIYEYLQLYFTEYGVLGALRVLLPSDTHEEDKKVQRIEKKKAAQRRRDQVIRLIDEMNVCMYQRVFMCVCIYVCMNVCMRVYTYILTFIHTYSHTYMHAYILTYIDNIYSYILTYVHIHI